ncbi:MAG: hypothetical protein IH944_10830 [Armatimonadetes bacterium]|nr:hypothetical protein [Armatimonadota bacterium]
MDSRGLISLSYDGSLPCHTDVVMRHLSSRGLRATFYVEPALMLESISDWQAASAAGHEVGNGCLHSIAATDGSISSWFVGSLAEEVQEAKELIEEAFPGQAEHSFGYPWGQPVPGHEGYAPAISRSYSVARSGVAGFNEPGAVNRQQIRCIPCDGMSAEEMTEYAMAARTRECWAVFSFEGLGVGRRTVDVEQHARFCDWLASANDIKVAPVVEHAASLEPSMPGTAHLR